MALIGPGTTYPDTDAQEAANEAACIEARKAAGVPNPENIDIDCEEECPIRLISCPFGVPSKAGRT